MFSQDQEYRNTFKLEIEQYQRGYQNVVNDLHRKLNLRNRDVVVNKGRLPPNQPSSIQPNKEKQKEDIVKKALENKKETSKENEKTITSFSLQNEISKIKISIPFNELLKNNEYIKEITKMVKLKEKSSL